MGNRWKTEEIWPFRAKCEGLGGWFGPPIDQISMDIEGFHLIIELISWLRACPKGTHLVVADDNIEQLIVEVPTQATENQGHGPKNAEKRIVWARNATVSTAFGAKIAWFRGFFAHFQELIEQQKGAGINEYYMRSLTLGPWPESMAGTGLVAKEESQVMRYLRAVGPKKLDKELGFQRFSTSFNEFQELSII